MARANALYYAGRDPFRDFATAPEMTQVFGEVLGAWAKIAWAMMGAPSLFHLAEAGPGRGTLMADARRVFAPEQIHFIETSPRLRAEQRRRVPDAVWHSTLATLPPGPLVLLANEFLDALPVRQFIRQDIWMERFVAAGAYFEQPAVMTLPDDPVGSIREIGEAAMAFVRQIARRQGVALLIDYGPLESNAGASVQAIKDGRFADPLADPGCADITAHVDFAALAAAARAAGAAVQGPVKQNAFLASLGFFQRTGALAQQNPDRAETLRQAAQRLTAPEAMGSLFKVMAICPKNFAPLPGFEC